MHTHTHTPFVSPLPPVPTGQAGFCGKPSRPVGPGQRGKYGETFSSAPGQPLQTKLKHHFLQDFGSGESFTAGQRLQPPLCVSSMLLWSVFEMDLIHFLMNKSKNKEPALKYTFYFRIYRVFYFCASSWQIRCLGILWF
ncbi:Hypothetical predicted protein [Podarcis lilfordi]|uniref:Uncharacterized protein n=1 Tax=Podarcis lilfordi TaxID=74358 RepID=A0AA35LLK8_9SAUR|nr:Hypothetical predicted protein [Podarcis lilfordi]